MQLPKYLQKKKIILLVVIIVVIVAGYMYFAGGGDEEKYDTIIADRGELVQEVDVSGKIKPAQSVNLAFEKGGKVSHVYVKTGQQVSAGQALAAIENGDIYASLLQAEAGLDAENARLSELQKGTRVEEIAVQEAKIKSAESTLVDENQDLFNAMQDAFTKADDAVHNKADALFSNPNSSSPVLNLVSISSQLKINIERERLDIEPLLVDWKNTLGSIDVVTVKNSLDKTKILMDNIASAVNSLTPSSSLSQTTIDGYKADISTARTNINTAITSVVSAEQAVLTAEYNLTTAEKQLELQKAGATPEQINVQEAAVRAAEAQIANYNAQLAKTVIRAPFAGIVTAQDAKVGSIVTAGVKIISLISQAEFEVESFIPEADIAGLSVGNTAKFTLDAYEEDLIFDAVVSHVDPAETIIEGVPTYKVTLSLIDADERIKSGMTADLSILIEKRDNTIVVPVRAVQTKNGRKTVRLLINGAPEEREVETGLRGSDGRIEIISGIQEGDTVIVFEKK